VKLPPIVKLVGDTARVRDIAESVARKGHRSLREDDVNLLLELSCVALEVRTQALVTNAERRARKS
jgi:hypothetical protein